MKHFVLFISLLAILVDCAHSVPTITRECNTQEEWNEMWTDAIKKANRSAGNLCKIDAVDPSSRHWMGKVRVNVDFPDVYVYFNGTIDGEQVSSKNRFKDALGIYDGYVGY